MSCSCRVPRRSHLVSFKCSLERRAYTHGSGHNDLFLVICKEVAPLHPKPKENRCNHHEHHHHQNNSESS